MESKLVRSCRAPIAVAAVDPAGLPLQPGRASQRFLCSAGRRSRRQRSGARNCGIGLQADWCNIASRVLHRLSSVPMSHAAFRWQVLIIVCVVGANAFPANFLRRHTPASCNAHPNQALGPHGSPQEDGEIQVTLTPLGPPSNDVAASNANDQTFCPGREYMLKVAFPEPRLGLLTVNKGTDATTKCSTDVSGEECCTDASGTRWLLTTLYDDAQDSFNVTMYIPCGVTESLQAKVTSARSASSYYYQISKTFQLGQNCGACVPPRSPRTPPSPPLPRKIVHKPPTIQSPALTPPPPAPHRSPVVTMNATVPTCSNEVTAPQANSQSSLGYSNMLDVGGLTLHWTQSSCAPDNVCTQIAGWNSKAGQTAGLANRTLLHFAAEGVTTGYVSVGFGPVAGQMEGTHAVVGYVDDAQGLGVVKVYKLEAISLGQELPLNGSSMMLYSGVVQTSDKRTILCFASALEEMNGVDSFPQLVPGESLAVNWAVGESDKLVHHDKSGGMQLQLLEQKIDPVAPTPLRSTEQMPQPVNRHAEGRTSQQAEEALFILAWFLLHPLGVIAARQKWVFGQKHVGGVEVWLMVHMMLHMAGVSLQISALALAWSSFGADNPGRHSLFRAQLTLGTGALVLSTLQGLGGIVRGRLSQSQHGAWKNLHRGTGMLAVALGWTACILGAILSHEVYQEPYWWWVIPCIVAAVVLCTMDGLLSVFQHDTKNSNGKVAPGSSPQTDVPKTDASIQPAVVDPFSQRGVNPLWSQVSTASEQGVNPLWSLDSTVSDIERPILASKISRGLQPSVL